MVKDSESHIRSRKKSLSRFSNAGGFKRQWEKRKQVRKRGFGYNWVTAWKWPLWRTLGQLHGSEATSGSTWVVAWPPGGQLCWHRAAGQWQSPTAKGKEPASLPMSPSVGHFLSQICNCAKPRPCPRELPKGGLHGVSQGHLSSVSTVLCSAQGQKDWFPLAFRDSGNERADVWGWGPTRLKCVHVSPVNVTALLKDLSWNTVAPGRSWWCWNPSWSLVHTSFSFSALASKVSLLFLLKTRHNYECQHRFLLVST